MNNLELYISTPQYADYKAKEAVAYNLEEIVTDLESLIIEYSLKSGKAAREVLMAKKAMKTTLEYKAWLEAQDD